MALNPIIFIFFFLLISIAALIRVQRHPKFPIITTFLLIIAMINIVFFYTVDSAISASYITLGDPSVSEFILSVVVNDFDSASLNEYYLAFEQLKNCFIVLIVIIHLSLLWETGIILHHRKKETKK